jgi:serine protease AprX
MNRKFKIGTAALNRFLVMSILILGISREGQALHAPKEWFEGEKLEPALRDLPAEQSVDVIIAFVGSDENGGLPAERVGQLFKWGLGYRSPVHRTLQVTNIPAGVLRREVRQWEEVGKVFLNRTARPSMTTAGQAVKAHAGFFSPGTAEEGGLDGTGVTIAICDTGVDDHTHAALPVAIGGLFIEADALGTLSVQLGNPEDVNGHGTGVAGVVLSRGDAAGSNRGVAPSAELFDLRVTEPGPGNPITVVSLQMAIDWLTLFGSSTTPPIRVASFALNFDAPPAGGHVITSSLNALSQTGIVVVVSAGNSDSCPGLDLDPIAVSETAITVAAASHEGTVDRGDDVIADYSRRGPGPGPEDKPNLTAYGRQCVVDCATLDCSAAPTSEILSAAPPNAFGALDGGTSSACALVAGAAALLVQKNSAISPAAVKSDLMTQAEDKGAAGWDPEWGAGLLDLWFLNPVVPPPTPQQPVPPPTPTDLAVVGVSSDPMPGRCFRAIQVTVEVQNVGTVPVSNFEVLFERWFLGPNMRPPLRYPLSASPVPNTQGPLNPGDVRAFTEVWIPGVSDNLPISEHSCFWGTVIDPNDGNANNNERNANNTILGLRGTHCLVPGDGAGEGEEFPQLTFRVANPSLLEATSARLSILEMPANWFVEIGVDDDVGQVLDVEIPRACFVEGRVNAFPDQPGANPPGRFVIEARDERGELLGDMTIDVVDRTVDPPCEGESDTRCLGLVIDGPDGTPGVYTVFAQGEDDSGDIVLYSFVVESSEGIRRAQGPQSDPEASFFLGSGEWTITVFADDSVECTDVADGNFCLTTLVVENEETFFRGDANTDGTVTLSDSVFTFEWLFRGGPSPQCTDSADSNDDGRVDISDGIGILSFLFLGTFAIPAPGTDSCGADPTRDDLSCGSAGPCEIRLEDAISMSLAFSRDPTDARGIVLEVDERFRFSQDPDVVLGLMLRPTGSRGPFSYSGSAVHRDELFVVFDPRIAFPEIDAANDLGWEYAVQLGVEGLVEIDPISRRRRPWPPPWRPDGPTVAGRPMPPTFVWGTPLPADKGPCMMGETPEDCLQRQMQQWRDTVCAQRPPMTELCNKLTSLLMPPNPRIGQGPGCSIARYPTAAGTADSVTGDVRLNGDAMLTSPCAWEIWIHEAFHSIDVDANPGGLNCAKRIALECSAFQRSRDLHPFFLPDLTMGDGQRWAKELISVFFSEMIADVHTKCTDGTYSDGFTPANRTALCTCLGEMEMWLTNNPQVKANFIKQQPNFENWLKNSKTNIRCP